MMPRHGPAGSLVPSSFHLPAVFASPGTSEYNHRLRNF